jgi:hypothetical protein
MCDLQSVSKASFSAKFGYLKKLNKVSLQNLLSRMDSTRPSHKELNYRDDRDIPVQQPNNTNHYERNNPQIYMSRVPPGYVLPHGYVQPQYIPPPQSPHYFPQYLPPNYQSPFQPFLHKEPSDYTKQIILDGGYNQANGIPGYSIKEGTVKNGLVKNLPKSAFPEKKKEQDPPKSKLTEEMIRLMLKMEGLAPKKDKQAQKDQEHLNGKQDIQEKPSKNLEQQIREIEGDDDVDYEIPEFLGDEEKDEKDEEDEYSYHSELDPIGKQFDKEWEEQFGNQHQKPIEKNLSEKRIVEKMDVNENKKQKISSKKGCQFVSRFPV